MRSVQNMLDDQKTDYLISKVDSKYVPIFGAKDYSRQDKRAIYRYLFSRDPKKFPPSLKNRLIGLYDPMADRGRRFPDGLRWCLNVYVGCEHNCGYCYVNGYNPETVGISPHPKTNFEKDLTRDIENLLSLCVPPAPLHLSNSTDLLQSALERKYGHTLFALILIAKHRSQFTSLVILTKNPAMLCEAEYLSTISSPEIKPITVQITCAFWRDEPRAFYEPHAPSIDNRLNAMKSLADNGIDVELRIDPLFPSARINREIRGHDELAHYSILEAQTQEDITQLVRFAKGVGAKAVIAKPLKVPLSKKAQQCKDWFGKLYSDAARSHGRTARGGSWRLPPDYQEGLVFSVKAICIKERIEFRHCKQDVANRK
jgi:DNA repair photolyase